MCNHGEESVPPTQDKETGENLTEMQVQVSYFQAEDFIRANQFNSSKSLSLLRCIYDYTKHQEEQAKSILNLATFGNVARARKSKKRRRVLLSATERPVNKLIVDSFDADQIWQELQLQNNLMYETLVSSTSKILAKSHNSNAANDESMPPDGVKMTKRKLIGEPEEDSEDESVIEFEGLEGDKKKSRLRTGLKHSKGYPKSEVDDKFFNLAQMTEFLEKVEAQIESAEPEELDSEDDIDMFADIDEEAKEVQNDDDGSNVYYQKFFDKPLDEEQSNEENRNMKTGNDTTEKKSKSVRWNLDKESDAEGGEGGSSEVEDDQIMPDDDDASEGDEEPSNEPSNFEKRRRKIEQSIEEIEQAALDPKPWKYQGEVTAEKRPENSLLEEHLVYDSLVRPAPEITVETTQKLEDIIKQRIKDKAWDDVERKVKPVEDPNEFKKKIVLNAEKSKMSLAQIYEQEYIEKKKAEEGEAEVESKPEEEIAIERDMKSLFAKLDALSNFHYTPKPVSTEIRIVTNVPAIAMEEVAPVNVADSTLLAPQEIQAPAKGEIKGKDERTDTDRKRERRIKKKKQKFKHLAREEKEKRKEARLQTKLNNKTDEKVQTVRKNQIKFK